MRLELVNAIGSSVYEYERILYPEDRCELIYCKQVTDAPRRTVDVYRCLDEDVVGIYYYYESGDIDTSSRGLEIHTTPKTDPLNFKKHH